MYFILCACASCVYAHHMSAGGRRGQQSLSDALELGLESVGSFKCVLGPKTLVLCASGALKQLNQFPNPLLVSYLN